jgi:GNAT superfamily N-acetyltransferase
LLITHNFAVTPIPGEKRADEDGGEEEETCGEIDIMIATPEQRRKGLGEAAVRAFLQFLTRHRDDIMSEYSHARTQRTGDGTRARNARLKRLVAKINADNAGSIRLFENLGFRRDGEPNYFDEVSLVLSFGDLPATANSGTESEGRGYREVVYDRSRLKGVEK